MKQKPIIETCYSTALYPFYHRTDAIVVVIDILRASSSICAAFENGVTAIYPVAGIKEALNLKNNYGWLIAAERDGLKIDEADIGNSPHYFSADRIENKTIIYSTTNGTKAIQMTIGSYETLIGAFSNLNALTNYLLEQNKNILLFCSGWKQKFNIEDTLFAGALASTLIEKENFDIDCDSTIAAMDLWNIAKTDLKGYAKKIAWTKRLDMPDVFEYCLTLNSTKHIPYYDKNQILSKKIR